jgi:hypothetical protein
MSIRNRYPGDRGSEISNLRGERDVSPGRTTHKLEKSVDWINREFYKSSKMAFFRQYIAPLLVVIVFAIALVAVSARIFLPSDLAAPAPIEEMESANSAAASSLPAVPEALTENNPS